MSTITIKNRLRAVGLTDIGRVRTLNEDNFLLDEQLGLLLVADGMGGHDAGEVASREVLKSIQMRLIDPTDMSYLDLGGFDDDDDDDDDDEMPTLDNVSNPLIDAVSQSIQYANSAIFTINQERGYPKGTGMGTTIVGLWMTLMSESLLVFHVGDSRCYRFSRGELTQLTQDHSMYRQWLDFGSVGPAPTRNVLSQAMGPGSSVVPDISFVSGLNSGDLLLLCSDGLNRMVPDEQICDHLAALDSGSLETVAVELVEAAKNNGGKDNITVILIEVI